jgi:protein TonB
LQKRIVFLPQITKVSKNKTIIIMEIKKSERADLERGKSTSLLIGFVMALSVMFVALEWTQREVEDNSEIYMSKDVSLNEEMVPITLPEKKTVPPPPAAVSQADILEIVDDDAEIEEDIMASTEDQVEWVDLDEIDYVEVEPEPEEEEIFMVVEESPEFPGGVQALLEYLRKNIKYPQICKDNNIQGRVLISFVVNKDGAIVDPEVIKSVHPSLDKEALRVISGMPNWKPGAQRGKPVRVKYTVPVNFRLN